MKKSCLDPCPWRRDLFFIFKSQTVLFILFCFHLGNGLTACASTSSSSPPFYTSTQKEIYLLLWDLEFEKASSLLFKESKRNASLPSNFALKSLSLTLQLLLEGDKLHYYQEKKKESLWLDSLSKGKKDGKSYYSSALIKLHWGLLKSVFGEGLSGAFAMRQAFLLLKQHVLIDSSQKENQVYYGAFRVALSNIPENYQWAAQLAGMEKNEKEGWDILQKARISSDEIVVLEAKLFSLILKNYLQYPREEILTACAALSSQYPQKGIYALCSWLYNKCNASEKAKELLSKLDANERYPYFFYLKGLTSFQLLEKEQAKHFFQKYIMLSKSTNYKKDALYKLSVLYTLEGDSTKASKYRERVKKQGSTLYYADKQALKMVYKQKIPHTLLLGKMALDGGLFATSIQFLSNTPHQNLTTKVEINYLLAKNYQLMGNWEKAKTYYQKTIHFCPKEGLYYGPMACWVLAKEYNEEGDASQMNLYLTRLGTFQSYEHKRDILEKVARLKK